MNQSPQTDSRQKALQQAGVLCYAASRAAQAASTDPTVRADAVAAAAASLRQIATASAEAQIRGLQLAAESCQAGLASILKNGAAEEDLAAKLLGECTAEIGRIISELSKGADGAVGLGFVNEMRVLAGLPALSDEDVRPLAAAAQAGGEAAGTAGPSSEGAAATSPEAATGVVAAAEAGTPAVDVDAGQMLTPAASEPDAQLLASTQPGAEVVADMSPAGDEQVDADVESGSGDQVPAVAQASINPEPADKVADAAGAPAEVTDSPLCNTTTMDAGVPASASAEVVAVAGDGRAAAAASLEQAAEGELEALSERLSALIAGAKAAMSRSTPGGAQGSLPETAAVTATSQPDAMAGPPATSIEPAAVAASESRPTGNEPTGEVGVQLTVAAAGESGLELTAPSEPAAVGDTEAAGLVQSSQAARVSAATLIEGDAGESPAAISAEPSGDVSMADVPAAGSFAANVQAALDAVDATPAPTAGSETMASAPGTPEGPTDVVAPPAAPAEASSEAIATQAHAPAEALASPASELGTVADAGVMAPTADADAAAVPTAEAAGVAVEAIPAGDPAAPQELTAEQMAALMAGDMGAEGADPSLEWGSVPLALAPEKAEMLQFMVADNKAAIEQLAFIIPQLAEFAGREDAGAALADIASSAENMCDFFDFKSLKSLTGILREVATSVATINDAVMPELTVRLNALRSLFEQHVRGLECGMELRWPLTVFCDRIRACLRGEAMHPQIAGWHNDDIERVLELDMVNEGINNPPKPEDLAPWTPVMAEASRKATGEVEGAKAAKKNDSSVVRVPAVTLDKMLELISQLVLTKNRLFNLARELRQPALRERRIEDINSAADELTMLTSSLQIAMMQARMQPIAKLFERYERVVSDVAGVAEKQVLLKTGGEGVDVDKNIFDGLAEPMSLLLRHIVTKAVQLPQERTKAGKSPSALISVDARNQSSSVLITVDHDGVPLDREAVLLAAVERGVAAEDRLDSMSDEEVWDLYTREGVTDPTLKAVSEALEAIKGTFKVRPHKGLTRFECVLPLSIAIITAILVDIGGEVYAIPLTSVEEIVGLDDVKINRVNNRPVMRLREQVLPIVEGSEAVGIPRRKEPDEIGVVIAASDQRATLRVDGIVGKQEIVIKRLEGEIAHAGPFSGATIRNDGGISLIFDVADLLRRAAA